MEEPVAVRRKNRRAIQIERLTNAVEAALFTQHITLDGRAAWELTFFSRAPQGERGVLWSLDPSRDEDSKTAQRPVFEFRRTTTLPNQAWRFLSDVKARPLQADAEAVMELLLSLGFDPIRNCLRHGDCVWLTHIEPCLTEGMFLWYQKGADLLHDCVGKGLVPSTLVKLQDSAVPLDILSSLFVVWNGAPIDQVGLATGFVYFAGLIYDRQKKETRHYQVQEVWSLREVSKAAARRSQALRPSLRACELNAHRTPVRRLWKKDTKLAEVKLSAYPCAYLFRLSTGDPQDPFYTVITHTLKALGDQTVPLFERGGFDSYSQLPEWCADDRILYVGTMEPRKHAKTRKALETAVASLNRLMHYYDDLWATRDKERKDPTPADSLYPPELIDNTWHRKRNEVYQFEKQLLTVVATRVRHFRTFSSWTFWDVELLADPEPKCTLLIEEQCLARPPFSEISDTIWTGLDHASSEWNRYASALSKVLKRQSFWEHTRHGDVIQIVNGIRCKKPGIFLRYEEDKFRTRMQPPDSENGLSRLDYSKDPRGALPTWFPLSIGQNSTEYLHFVPSPLISFEGATWSQILAVTSVQVLDGKYPSRQISVPSPPCLISSKKEFRAALQSQSEWRPQGYPFPLAFGLSLVTGPKKKSLPLHWVVASSCAAVLKAKYPLVFHHSFWSEEANLVCPLPMSRLLILPEFNRTHCTRIGDYSANWKDSGDLYAAICRINDWMQICK